MTMTCTATALRLLFMFLRAPSSWSSRISGKNTPRVSAFDAEWLFRDLCDTHAAQLRHSERFSRFETSRALRRKPALLRDTCFDCSLSGFRRGPEACRLFAVPANSRVQTCFLLKSCFFFLQILSLLAVPSRSIR